MFGDFIFNWAINSICIFNATDKKKVAINLKRTINTIVISIISVLIVTILFIVFNHAKIEIWHTVISAIIVSIVWALLLSACYYVYQILSNNVKK